MRREIIKTSSALARYFEKTYSANRNKLVLRSQFIRYHLKDILNTQKRLPQIQSTQGGSINYSRCKSFSQIVQSIISQMCCYSYNINIHVQLRKAISTTMGLKYPLKKFDSKWPFPMGIWNDFITIFGKDCHIWNNAPRSLLSKVT